MRAYRLTLALLICAAAPACDFKAPGNDGGSTSPQKDGSPCTSNDGCKSNACTGGFCAGSVCACGTLMPCGTEPRTSPDCVGSWKCVGTPISVFVSGVCRLPCAAACPSGWQCKNDFCIYVPPAPSMPAVTIDQAPEELETGKAGQFKATATSANGAISTFSWSFGDGKTSDAFSTVHAYSEPGIFTITATATDAIGESGSAMTTLRACLPLGTECYPFDQRGNCCTSKRCAKGPDAGFICQE